MKQCLVIDESAVVREIAARIFGALDFSVQLASDAVEGLEHYKAHKPVLVLLDWDLPAMGALDFLRGISQNGQSEVPVILCATENQPQQFTLARAAGAGYHILKPFDLPQLRALLITMGLVEDDGAPRSQYDY